MINKRPYWNLKDGEGTKYLMFAISHLHYQPSIHLFTIMRWIKNQWKAKRILVYQISTTIQPKKKGRQGEILTLRV